MIKGYRGPNERRKTALKGLQKQLAGGVRILKDGTQVPLTDKDKIRINREIDTLKSRII